MDPRTPYISPKNSKDTTQIWEHPWHILFPYLRIWNSENDGSSAYLFFHFWFLKFWNFEQFPTFPTLTVRTFARRDESHISKILLMFSARHWSHVQDFQEFIRRIFIICRWRWFPTKSKMIFKISSGIKTYLSKNALFKWFGIFESINRGSKGSRNPEIMQMLGLGLSHNNIDKLKIQIEAE